MAVDLENILVKQAGVHASRLSFGVRHSLIYTYGRFSIVDGPTGMFFGHWKKTSEPSGNPCEFEANMQNPTQTVKSTLKPWSCATATHPAVSLCRPINLIVVS